MAEIPEGAGVQAAANARLIIEAVSKVARIREIEARVNALEAKRPRTSSKTVKKTRV